MIILSLNIRGLGSISTKKSLERIIFLHKPNIFMLQETMGMEKKSLGDLDFVLKE
jgi:hypothetical protein